MRLAAHVTRFFWEALCYGTRQRRLALLVAVVVGALFLAVGLASQTAAPVVLYPFA